MLREKLNKIWFEQVKGRQIDVEILNLGVTSFASTTYGTRLVVPVSYTGKGKFLGEDGNTYPIETGFAFEPIHNTRWALVNKWNRAVRLQPAIKLCDCPIEDILRRGCSCGGV